MKSRRLPRGGRTDAGPTETTPLVIELTAEQNAKRRKLQELAQRHYTDEIKTDLTRRLPTMSSEVHSRLTGTAIDKAVELVRQITELDQKHDREQARQSFARTGRNAAGRKAEAELAAFDKFRRGAAKMEAAAYDFLADGNGRPKETETWKSASEDERRKIVDTFLSRIRATRRRHRRK